MKTQMSMYTILLCCSLSHSQIDSDQAEQIEKGFEASKQFVETLLEISKGLDTKDYTSGVQNALQMFGKITEKFLPLMGFSAPLVSFGLTFLEKESSELTYMKKKFAEVHQKLQSTSLKLNSLEKSIDWANYASVYARDQNNIVNSWNKLTEFMRSIETHTSAKDRVRFANQFVRSYELSGTENSVANMYRYVTEKNPFSLNKNLLVLVIEKTSGDVRNITAYGSYLSMVMLTGLRLNLYYYQTKRHYNTYMKVRESVEQFVNFQKALQDAVIECANDYQRWAKQEVERALLDISPDDKAEEISKTIEEKLKAKFDWFRWSVIVHEKGQDCRGWGHSMEFEHGEKKIHIIVQAKSKEKLRTTWGSDCPIVLKPETEYIHATKYNGGLGDEEVACDNYQSGITVPGFIYKQYEAVFFKAKTDDQPCMSSCQRGKCVQLKDSDVFFCKCTGMFYGPACKSNVYDAIGFSAIQEDVSDALSQYVVPDITAVYFKLQKLEGNTKQLLQQVTELTQRCTHPK